MRSIGTIDEATPAKLFSLYLLDRGVENQVEALPGGGYEVWVLSEDHVTEARDLLARFREDPANPEFERRARAALARLEKRAERERRSRSRRIDPRPAWQAALAGKIPPVTLWLILVSIGVFIWANLRPDKQAPDFLFITAIRTEGNFIYRRPGLPEIMHGEIWRLFTPMFIHFGFIHILFNLLWLKDLGSLLERRYGPLPFVLLVAGTSALSNLAQYFATGPSFGGMSGVVFGLLGFVWIRGRFDPNTGFHLPRTIVYMMAAWFFVCLVGIVPHVANTAHAVGLGVGMAWGYLSALRARRPRRGPF